MRKFLETIAVDTSGFDPYLIITMKDESGSNTVLLKTKMEPDNSVKSKYSLTEQKRIDRINQLLMERGFATMTEPESDFLIDPNGLRWNKIDTNTEDLQRLAGFTVEKKITYYDDLKEEKIND